MQVFDIKELGFVYAFSERFSESKTSRKQIINSKPKHDV